MKIIEKLTAKIKELTNKRDKYTEEFEKKLAQGKPVEISFQKKRARNEGELFGYKKALEIVKNNRNE